mmetsp:Transcript_8620/g.8751  ORF Transcript_8620/g.8751 Transcript_8620/m.8751 type:complete len:113 (+) Transcript_8620:143-481(+)
MEFLDIANASSLTYNPKHFVRRAIGSAGIIAIVLFSLLAICLCSGAIYLLAKNKNLSDIIEDATDDGSCPTCDAYVLGDVQDLSSDSQSQTTSMSTTSSKIGVVSIHKSLIG